MDEIDAALDFKNVRFETCLCYTIVSLLHTSIFIHHDLMIYTVIALFIFVGVGIHRRELHQRTYQERTICDHFPP